MTQAAVVRITTDANTPARWRVYFHTGEQGKTNESGTRQQHTTKNGRFAG
jgi:hypothetical protein